MATRAPRIENLRLILLVSTAITVVIGTLTIALGCYSLEHEGVDVVDEHLGDTLIVGVIITVTSIFAFYGVFRDLIFAIQAYAIYLIFASCVMTVTTGILFGFMGRLKKQAQKDLRKLFGDIAGNEDEIDELQSDYECCGLTGPNWWTTDIPSSCCADTGACTIAKSFEESCKDVVQDLVSLIALLTGGMFISIVVFSLFNAAVAFLLLKAHNERPIIRGYGGAITT